MKRELDDIELKEFECFYIDQTTLIIKTKTEEISYSYPNSLELLRRIGYLLHRYEVEYNRKKDQAKDKSDSSLTPTQKECKNRLMKSRNIVFSVYGLYMILSLIFPNYSSVLLNLFVAADGIVLIGIMRDIQILKSEALKQQKENQNYESQLNKGFESLKEAALSYLNRITKTTTSFNMEEKHYIEEIEKGFQKRIGTYPQQ